MSAGQGLAIFINLVKIGFLRICSGALGGSGVGVVGGFDAYTQFDALAEPAAERIDDRCPQVTFDFILDEGARNRQQRESLRDRQWSHELQPGTLLRCQRRVREGDIVAGL